MIGDDSVRNGHFSVFNAAEVCDAVDYRFEEVTVVVRFPVLQNCGDSLKSGSGIDMFVREFDYFSVAAAVILDENQVPKFDVSSADSVDLANMIGILFVASFRS